MKAEQHIPWRLKEGEVRGITNMGRELGRQVGCPQHREQEE